MREGLERCAAVDLRRHPRRARPHGGRRPTPNRSGTSFAIPSQLMMGKMERTDPAPHATRPKPNDGEPPGWKPTAIAQDPARPDFAGFVRVPRGAGAQPQERRPRHPARRPGRLHGRLRLGQVVAGVRHALRARRSGGTSNRSRPTPGGCSTSWACPRSTRSTACRPAVALQQQRGSPTTRSSVGSVTTLSNLLRMLYSRAGDYPPGQPLLYAESFSPNTPEGACPECHGLGRVYEVTERVDGAGRLAHDPRAGRRRLADRLARAEPPRDPDDARLRRRPPLARAAAEGPRLDPLHRRAADRAGLLRATRRRRCGGRSSGRRSRATGDVHQRPAARAAHLRQHAEPADEEAGARSTC